MSLILTQVQQVNSSELTGEPMQPEPRELKRNGHLSEWGLTWERPGLRQLGR